MSNDDVRAGEELARVWLQGKSGLSDDLAALVAGLGRPFDATVRTFLQTIGNAAKASAKRGPTPSARRAAAAPPAEPPPAAPVDLNELLRRRRERERAARLGELGRRNQEAWLEQSAMLDAARRF